MADSVVVRTVPLVLGETEVALAVHESGRPGPAMLALHDDENDAVEAGRAFVAERGGRLVEVRAQGERNVAFRLGGRDWRFDPNRVFTPAGARRTLTDLNGSAPEAALAAARRFADAVLDAYGLDSARVVVTLHNNTPGRYSAASYAPGADLAAEAEALHLPEDADPDDFFFVTDRCLYDALVPQGWAAVLQDNARATDDGSLSVLCAQRGIPYVNVEAEHGHAAEQRAMLDALARVLETTGR